MYTGLLYLPFFTEHKSPIQGYGNGSAYAVVVATIPKQVQEVNTCVEGLKGKEKSIATEYYPTMYIPKDNLVVHTIGGHTGTGSEYKMCRGPELIL